MITRLKFSLLSILHAVFYHNRLDTSGNVFQPKGLSIITSRFNQYLIENGYSPRWNFTAESCRTFWSSDVNKSDNPNASPYYSKKAPVLIHFLHEFWQPYIRPNYSFLELGCNCGPNLEMLRKLGYHNLGGVEINADAVELMRDLFPELYGDVSVETGSLEETLPRLSANSADVIFTVAVLMHVHPDSHEVFSEMVRVARKHIVVLEPEFANCNYVFSRNYRRVFHRLGCTQLRALKIGIDQTPDLLRDYHGVIIRVFDVPTI